MCGLAPVDLAPMLTGSCCFLRGEVIDAVGLLEPVFTSITLAAADWVERAKGLGFVAKRANHVFVRQLKPGGPSPTNHGMLDLSRPFLAERHDCHEPRIDRSQITIEHRMVAHAVHLQAIGRMRVACDLRYLPREQVGTRTYAVSLVKALAELSEIDLTLLVRESAQAEGLRGGVVTEAEWNDDVAVIHRPAQVLDPRGSSPAL